MYFFWPHKVLEFDQTVLELIKKKVYIVQKLNLETIVTSSQSYLPYQWHAEIERKYISRW